MGLGRDEGKGKGSWVRGVRVRVLELSATSRKYSSSLITSPLTPTLTILIKAQFEFSTFNWH